MQEGGVFALRHADVSEKSIEIFSGPAPTADQVPEPILALIRSQPALVERSDDVHGLHGPSGLLSGQALDWDGQAYQGSYHTRD